MASISSSCGLTAQMIAARYPRLPIIAATAPAALSPTWPGRSLVWEPTAAVLETKPAARPATRKPNSLRGYRGSSPQLAAASYDDGLFKVGHRTLATLHSAVETSQLAFSQTTARGSWPGSPEPGYIEDLCNGSPAREALSGANIAESAIHSPCAAAGIAAA